MNRHKNVESIVQFIFLILGLVTIASVLMITIYLVIAGIPAIREIGLIDFLFGKEWASTAADPSLHPDQYIRYCRRHGHWCADRIYDSSVYCQGGTSQGQDDH